MGNFFSDLGSGGRTKKQKKTQKMTSLLVNFRAFFFFFFFIELFYCYFFNISRKNSKTSEVNVYLYIFHHFPKNMDRTITFNSVTLKNAQTEHQKKFFFSTKQIIFRVGG